MEREKEVSQPVKVTGSGKVTLTNQSGDTIADGLKLKSLSILGPGQFRFCGFGQVQSAPAPDRHPRIRASFASAELAEKSKTEVKIVDVSLPELSLLVIGSMWDGNRLASIPEADRTFTIDFGADTRSLPDGFEVITRDDVSREKFPIYFRNHAPLLAFRTSMGQRAIFPVTELLRVFYWFNSRTIRSVNGGLFNLQCLPNQNFEAWREGGKTDWVDYASRIARIQRGKNTSDNLAKRIARFRFSERGKIAITELHKAFLHAFSNQLPTRFGPQLLTLPAVLPPLFGRVVVTASTVDVAKSEAVPQFLVMRIVKIDAPLPFADIQVGEDNASNENESDQPDQDPARAWGIQRSEPPETDGDVDVDDGPTDGSTAPMVLQGFGMSDQILERLLIQRPPAGEPRSRNRGEHQEQGGRGGRGGLGEAESCGKGNAEIVIKAEPVDTTKPPPVYPICGALKPTQRAFEMAIKTLTTRYPGEVFSELQFPARKHAYVVAPSNTKATTFVPAHLARQLVIWELRYGRRWGYAIDLEPKYNEQFALLAIARVDRTRMSLVDFIDIAAKGVEATKGGPAWYKSAALGPTYRGAAVVHPHKERPSDGDIAGFATRIAERVFDLIR